MATRSTIALEFADGTIGQVYCHWDGYPSHTGEILLEHYSDPFKLRELIDHGNLSVIGKDIGFKHPFENPYKLGTTEYNEFHIRFKDMCLFYRRDRDDYDSRAIFYKNFRDYVDNHEYQEYEYILRTDGNWYVCKTYYGEEYQLLTDMIAEEK